MDGVNCMGMDVACCIGIEVVVGMANGIVIEADMASIGIIACCVVVG